MKNNKYINLIFIYGFIAFFCLSVSELRTELKRGFNTLSNLCGLSGDVKKELLIGETYTFAALCNKIIPVNENVLFFTNLLSNTQSADLMISYAMYPRKLYLADFEDFFPDMPKELTSVNIQKMNKRIATQTYPDVPPEPDLLDLHDLERKKIKWIIYWYPKPLGITRVVEIEKGQAVKFYNLNIQEKTYDTYF